MSSLALGSSLVLFENKCEKLYGMRIDDNAVPGEIATLKELVTLSDTTGKSFQSAKSHGNTYTTAKMNGSRYRQKHS
jgi:hypothetical protein